MASEQKSEQKSEATKTSTSNATEITKQAIDEEIMTMKIKQLKAYIKANNSPYLTKVIPYNNKQPAINEKDEIRFIALDSVPSGWTKQRIQNLAVNYRRYFIEYKIRKIMGDTYDKEQEAKFSKYIQPNQHPQKDIDLIIDEIVQIINTNKNKTNHTTNNENKTETVDYLPKIDTDPSDEDEINQRALVRTEENNDMSTVSTHASMPSLMSDDESDDADDIDDDDDTDNASDDVPETKENILDTSSNEEEPKKTTVKSKKTKLKKKKDDFLTGMGAGFLNKKNKPKQTPKTPKTKPSKKQTPKMPPKAKQKNKTKVEKSQRKQLKIMGYSDATINKISAKIGEAASINEFVDEIGRLKASENAQKKAMREDRKKVGFRLSPENIDAHKSSDGDLFLCVGARPEKARLSGYRHLKCNVSLKWKLKKKAKKRPSYAAILIDLRQIAPRLRDIERQKLKKIGYENVLSFAWNANICIIDVQENGERKVSLDAAFKEYSETLVLRKEDKKVAKLVTAGFDDEEARKALEMSMNDDKNKKNNEQKEQYDTVIDAALNEFEKTVSEKQKILPNHENIGSDEKAKPFEKNDNDKNKGTAKPKISAKNDQSMKKKVIQAAKNKNDDIKEEESSKNKKKKVIEKQKISPKNGTNLAAKISNKKSNDTVKNKKEKVSKPIDKTEHKKVPQTQKIFTQNAEIKEETDDISCELMNLCRFNQHDLLSVIDDPEIDYTVHDVYIRVHFTANYKLYKICKTMDYPKPYSFLGVKTTKGLQISNGNTKSTKNIKLSKISNDAVTSSELTAWKSKMARDAVPLPDIHTLTDISETIKILRVAASQKATNTRKTPTKPPQTLKSPPRPGAVAGLLSHSFKPHSHSSQYQGGMQLQQHLNAQILNVHNAALQNEPMQILLDRYLKAIQEGYTNWWCIPTAPADTTYVAFLLRKTKQYDSVLDGGIKLAMQIATERGYEIGYVRIRERVIEMDQSFKARGYLIDCKEKKCAMSIKTALEHFYPSHVRNAKHCTNFCRLVLAEFGAEYMRVQSLPSGQRPTVEKAMRNVPQGPKYGYKNGEASIEDMVLHMDEREIYGESDHTMSSGSIAVASDCTDKSELSAIVSHASYKSNLSAPTMKYGDVKHMIYLQQPGGVVEKKKKKKVKSVEVEKGRKGKEGRYKKGDVVLYGNEKYRVYEVFDDKLMIQSWFRTVTLLPAEYKKLSHINKQ